MNDLVDLYTLFFKLVEDYHLEVHYSKDVNYPMDCSMPGFPIHHQPLKFTQTHVNRVGDAMKPSHPLLFPSSPAFNLSQHQGLF